ncbi:MAG: urease accessory protein, partial [Burkholderiales bacterium]
MTMLAPHSPTQWRARLHLAYGRRGARTVLTERAHTGPLRVQKPLYPEGEAVCHTIVLHPPAGIAGGDQLELMAAVGRDAHVLLTTPGAGKWYRSAGARSALMQRIAVADGAVCEWLPQENIVFDGAVGDLVTEFALEGNACLIGAEMLCLGRTGSGECFTRGELAMRTRVRRNGETVWVERGRISGGGPLLSSPAGLRGQPVTGTLLVASRGCDAGLLQAAREESPSAGDGAVT